MELESLHVAASVRIALVASVAGSAIADAHEKALELVGWRDNIRRACGRAASMKGAGEACVEAVSTARILEAFLVHRHRHTNEHMSRVLGAAGVRHVLLVEVWEELNQVAASRHEVLVDQMAAVHAQ